MPINPQDYALVIGFNDYPSYGGAKGRSLRGAVRDATAFADWLRNTDTGGGVPEKNLSLITSSPNPLAPDRKRIDDDLESIVKAARKEGGRRLYLYFSGHGHVSGDDRNELALCLPHWSMDRRRAALSSDGYLKYLLKCSPFEEILVFFDCCRLKQVAALGLGTELECALPVEGKKRKVMLAYASEFLKAAFEGAAAGNDGGDADEGIIPEAEEVRGHFTKALLAALKAAAARPEGGVTVRALKGYLEKNVGRIAQAAGHNQQPQVPLDMEASDEDAIILGSALPEANLEIQFGAERQGLIELEASNLEVLKAGDAVTGPWRVRLERGLYMLREKATGFEKPLRFAPAEEVVSVTF